MKIIIFFALILFASIQVEGSIIKLKAKRWDNLRLSQTGGEMDLKVCCKSCQIGSGGFVSTMRTCGPYVCSGILADTVEVSGEINEPSFTWDWDCQIPETCKFLCVLTDEEWFVDDLGSCGIRRRSLNNGRAVCRVKLAAKWLQQPTNAGTLTFEEV